MTGDIINMKYEMLLPNRQNLVRSVLGLGETVNLDRCAHISFQWCITEEAEGRRWP
jgi:hypothetical protein